MQATDATATTNQGPATSSNSAASAGPAKVTRPSSVPAVTFIATNSAGDLATKGASASCADLYGVAATLLAPTSTYTTSGGASRASATAIMVCVTAMAMKTPVSTSRRGNRSAAHAPNGKAIAPGSSRASPTNPTAEVPPSPKAHTDSATSVKP